MADSGNMNTIDSIAEEMARKELGISSIDKDEDRQKMVADKAANFMVELENKVNVVFLQVSEMYSGSVPKNLRDMIIDNISFQIENNNLTNPTQLVINDEVINEISIKSMQLDQEVVPSADNIYEIQEKRIDKHFKKMTEDNKNKNDEKISDKNEKINKLRDIFNNKDYEEKLTKFNNSFVKESKEFIKELGFTNFEKLDDDLKKKYGGFTEKELNSIVKKSQSIGATKQDKDNVMIFQELMKQGLSETTDNQIIILGYALKSNNEILVTLAKNICELKKLDILDKNGEYDKAKAKSLIQDKYKKLNFDELDKEDIQKYLGISFNEKNYPNARSIIEEAMIEAQVEINSSLYQDYEETTDESIKTQLLNEFKENIKLSPDSALRTVAERSIFNKEIYESISDILKEDKIQREKNVKENIYQEGQLDELEPIGKGIYREDMYTLQNKAIVLRYGIDTCLCEEPPNYDFLNKMLTDFEYIDPNLTKIILGDITNGKCKSIEDFKKIENTTEIEPIIKSRQKIGNTELKFEKILRLTLGDQNDFSEEKKVELSKDALEFFAENKEYDKNSLYADIKKSAIANIVMSSKSVFSDLNVDENSQIYKDIFAEISPENQGEFIKLVSDNNAQYQNDIFSESTIFSKCIEITDQLSNPGENNKFIESLKEKKELENYEQLGFIHYLSSNSEKMFQNNNYELINKLIEEQPKFSFLVNDELLKYDVGQVFFNLMDKFDESKDSNVLNTIVNLASVSGENLEAGLTHLKSKSRSSFNKLLVYATKKYNNLDDEKDSKLESFIRRTVEFSIENQNNELIKENEIPVIIENGTITNKLIGNVIKANKEEITNSKENNLQNIMIHSDDYIKYNPLGAMATFTKIISDDSISKEKTDFFRDKIISGIKDKKIILDETKNKDIKNDFLKNVVKKEIASDKVISDDLVNFLVEFDFDFSKKILAEDLINNHNEKENFNIVNMQNIEKFSKVIKEHAQKKLLNPDKMDISVIAGSDMLSKSANKSNDNLNNEKKENEFQVKEEDDDRSL